mmetsp:Transcript_29090/g.93779  ORF Transcript_29090/g.93779 Transcript_29090/m.93779 type:complete len:209 (+) Transcript_29090:2885-3511(+)
MRSSWPGSACSTRATSTAWAPPPPAWPWLPCAAGPPPWPCSSRPSAPTGRKRCGLDPSASTAASSAPAGPSRTRPWTRPSPPRGSTCSAWRTRCRPRSPTSTRRRPRARPAPRPGRRRRRGRTRSMSTSSHSSPIGRSRCSSCSKPTSLPRPTRSPTTSSTCWPPPPRSRPSTEGKARSSSQPPCGRPQHCTGPPRSRSPCRLTRPRS